MLSEHRDNGHGSLPHRHTGVSPGGGGMGGRLQRGNILEKVRIQMGELGSLPGQPPLHQPWSSRGLTTSPSSTSWRPSAQGVPAGAPDTVKAVFLLPPVQTRPRHPGYRGAEGLTSPPPGAPNHPVSRKGVAVRPPADAHPLCASDSTAACEMCGVIGDGEARQCW